MPALYPQSASYHSEQAHRKSAPDGAAIHIMAFFSYVAESSFSGPVHSQSCETSLNRVKRLLNLVRFVAREFDAR